MKSIFGRVEKEKYWNGILLRTILDMLEELSLLYTDFHCSIGVIWLKAY